MPNPGDIIGGRFQIIRELGSGGFGTTYLAKSAIHLTSHRVAGA